MREKQKTVQLDGRTFIIRKLPAARGYALLVEILTKALPLNLIGSALEGFVPAGLLDTAGKQVMSLEELEALQLKLMASVSEILPAGETKVLDGQGNWQVEDLGDDMLLFGQLLVKVVVHQYQDFFTGVLSKLGISVADWETVWQAFWSAAQAPPNTFTPQSWPDTGDSMSFGTAPTQ